MNKEYQSQRKQKLECQSRKPNIQITGIFKRTETMEVNNRLFLSSKNFQVERNPLSTMNEKVPQEGTYHHKFQQVE